ncbi:MAG: alpha/beta fold hydrolase [Chloroflexi bacterium]|nr:alpha/beta fold hydrolase [Chloroflexota bacterium]
MKLKLPLLLLAAIILLDLVYLGVSYYFAGIIIGGETQTLAEGQAQQIRVIGELDLPAPETIRIDAGEVILAGNYYDNALDGRCAVLLLHGYTGTRYGALQYAPLFWERGCDVLTYDARGHGESSDAFHTFGYYEKEDGLAAYQWLLSRTGLTPDRVGLVGVSYGAAAALQMLPLLPDPAFVLADSSYSSWREIITHQADQQFGSWATWFVPGAFLVVWLRTGANVAEVSPQTAVTQSTTPILLVHAKEDGFTPAAHSQAIYAASNQATTELQITDWGADHGLSIIVDYAAFDQLTDGFLARHVPGFGLSDGR